MGGFPFLSAELELEESSVFLAVVVCTQPSGAELPRTFPCTDVEDFFFFFFLCWKWWIPEITKARKLSARSLWFRARKGSCWEHLSPWGPCHDLHLWQGISEEEWDVRAPTWRSERAGMAEMLGKQQCSQRVRSLWIEAMGVVHKRCFTKKRTQIGRNYPLSLLPWYFTIQLNQFFSDLWLLQPSSVAEQTDPWVNHPPFPSDLLLPWIKISALFTNISSLNELLRAATVDGC